MGAPSASKTPLKGSPSSDTRLTRVSTEPLVDRDGRDLAVSASASACGASVLEVRSYAGQQLSTLAMASVLAALEDDGDDIAAVRLLLRARADADWVVPLIEWLRAREIVVLLRTQVRLRPDLIECLRHESVPVEFELAHHRSELQCALLGDGADSVQALLLQSQHLSVIGVRQSVRFGPLLPGLHDPHEMRRMLALVRGADLHDYDLVVGELRADALAVLSQELGSAQGMALTRSFGVSPMVLFEGLETTLRLPMAMRRTMIAAYDRLATIESSLERRSPLSHALHEQGRGSVGRGALALELFADSRLVAS